MSTVAHALPRSAVNAKLIALVTAAAVFFGVFLSGFVIDEPAPYELYMAVLIAVWSLFGLRISRGIAPLVVNHQGQFPSVTITYNIKEGVPIADATAALTQAVAEMHMPDSIRTDFAGDVKAFRQSAGAQPLLLLSALIAVYIVLGVLYESLVHPLTIISTLPSAGLGALLALQVSGAELTVIAFIGIVLLIGIVFMLGMMVFFLSLFLRNDRK